MYTFCSETLVCVLKESSDFSRCIVMFWVYSSIDPICMQSLLYCMYCFIKDTSAANVRPTDPLRKCRLLVLSRYRIICLNRVQGRRACLGAGGKWCLASGVCTVSEYVVVLALCYPSTAVRRHERNKDSIPFKPIFCFFFFLYLIKYKCIGCGIIPKSWSSTFKRITHTKAQ